MEQGLYQMKREGRTSGGPFLHIILGLSSSAFRSERETRKKYTSESEFANAGHESSFEVLRLSRKRKISDFLSLFYFPGSSISILGRKSRSSEGSSSENSSTAKPIMEREKSPKLCSSKPRLTTGSRTSKTDPGGPREQKERGLT